MHKSLTLNALPMSLYVEPITDHTFSAYITMGDGRLHDERKGYGTVSADGKSVTWHTYQPPPPETPAEREALYWANSPLKRWADATWFNDWYRKSCAERGTTPEEVSKCLLDVINSAPPISVVLNRLSMTDEISDGKS